MATPSMPIAEFASKIRARFPGSYDDMKDDELVSKIVTKYPQYKDLVSAPTVAGPSKESLDAARRQEGEYIRRFGTATPDEGRFARPGEDARAAFGRGVIERGIDFAKGIPGMVAPPETGIESGLAAAGAMTGTGAGPLAAKRMMEAPFGMAAQMGTDLGQGNIGGALVNAGALGSMARGIGKAAPEVISDLTARPVNNMVPRDLVVAATKPSKGNLIGLDEHINGGFPDIAKTAADTGRKVRSMDDAVDVAESTKHDLWEQYALGRSPFNDVPVNTKLVAQAIRSTVSKKMLADVNQAGRVKAIYNLADIYERGDMPLKEADAYLKELNQELAKAKYFEKTPEAQYLAESQPSLEAKIAESMALRHIVRDTLERHGGSELAKLRDRYGSAADLKEMFQAAADRDVVAKAEAASKPALSKASELVSGITHSPLGTALGGAAGYGLGGIEGTAAGALMGGAIEGGARAIARRTASPDFLIAKAFDVYNPTSYPSTYFPNMAGTGQPQLPPGPIAMGPGPGGGNTGAPAPAAQTFGIHPEQMAGRPQLGPGMSTPANASPFPGQPPMGGTMGPLDPAIYARDLLNYLKYSPHEVTEHSLRVAASELSRMAGDQQPGPGAIRHGIELLLDAERATGGDFPQLRQIARQALQGPTRREAALSRGSEQPPPYAAPLEALDRGIIEQAISHLPYDKLVDLQQSLKDRAKEFPNLSDVVDSRIAGYRRNMLH